MEECSSQIPSDHAPPLRALSYTYTVPNSNQTLMKERSGPVSPTLAPFALIASHSHILAAQTQPSQRKPGRILVDHELDFSILHAVWAECG